MEISNRLAVTMSVLAVVFLALSVFIVMMTTPDKVCSEWIIVPKQLPW